MIVYGLRLHMSYDFISFVASELFHVYCSTYKFFIAYDSCVIVGTQIFLSEVAPNNRDNANISISICA